MENKSMKGWLYLLPALIFLGVFMVYPLIDVFIYSVEEGYNSASQSFYGYGAYNFSYVLHDTYSCRLSATRSFSLSSRSQFPQVSRCS